MTERSLSVLIPAYNEDGSIADTVNNINDVLIEEGFEQFEILVINDGSTDQTRENAIKTSATVQTHPHNLGYGKAIKTGLELAKFETIVITDADGTYENDKIPELVRKYGDGFDMVVGQRTGKYFWGSHVKKPLRLILRWLVEWATGRSIPDINSGLRVFSRDLALSYKSQLCDTFSFTTTLTLAFMMTGHFIAYIPIKYNKRIGESKVSLWSDSFRTCGYIIQSILYHSPLKIFIVLSFMFILLALFSIFVGMFLQLATGFTMGVGAIVAALVVFALGMLADLLKQILNNLRE